MSLKNKKVLITCGPTCVPIDGMRVISNRSTGSLGQGLARNLLAKGAKVTILEGPVTKPLQSKSIRIKKYFFYDELFALLRKELRNKFDIVIHAAAVSDYRLKKVSKRKLQSGLKRLNLQLVPTAKIINKIKKLAPKTFLVGFKLESSSSKKVLINEAEQLINTANCDLVVANSLKNHYKAYIINPEKEILGQAASRDILAKKLTKVIETQL